MPRQIVSDAGETINLDGDQGIQIKGSAVAVTTILDQDDMSSDSATALVTQQSVKAYVDAQVAAAGDVSGPAVSVDNTLPRFDGVSGKIIQASSVVVSDANAMSGLTSLAVDNITIDGNTISSTDTNGNINLTPNGTGNVVIDARGLDINPGSDADADLITVGVTGAPTISWNETQNRFEFSEDVSLGTNGALLVGEINIGSASATTLTNSGAGNLTIEGNLIYRAGGTDVPITDGGTGASTNSAAISNLVSGATVTTATVASDDKVLIQDTSDADNLKTVTAQAIANLASAGGGNIVTWVNFDGTSSPGSIRDSANVTSVTRNSTGDFTINFTSNYANGNYCLVGTCNQEQTGLDKPGVLSIRSTSGSLTTSTARIATREVNSTSQDLFNPNFVCVAIVS